MSGKNKMALRRSPLGPHRPSREFWEAISRRILLCHVRELSGDFVMICFLDCNLYHIIDGIYLGCVYVRCLTKDKLEVYKIKVTVKCHGNVTVILNPTENAWQPCWITGPWPRLLINVWKKMVGLKFRGISHDIHFYKVILIEIVHKFLGTFKFVMYFPCET